MKYLLKFFSPVSCLVLFCSLQVVASGGKGKGQELTLIIPASSHARVQFGAEKLAKALTDAGYSVRLQEKTELPKTKGLIVIGKLGDNLVKKASAGFGLPFSKTPGKEGFSISSRQKGQWIIGGADDSGTLYGCLELADKVRAKGELPESISMTDQPEMVLRGSCIGIQKTTYLPGRTVYEYPYTPEAFPWFYDKALWIKYLDSLVEYRLNSLYLWNGHPFASLVRLKDYPYALEVDEATFKKNEEMFRFLTEESDKRGIWVIQMFYNIILSKPFAEKHGLKTQDRSRPITPLIADYTRKSIAAFVEKYPNVGLLITLGEAMEGDDTDVEWFTKTIIPAVKDGLRAMGKTEEPPIVLRAHDSNPQLVMKAALQLYKNLYTMAKYNGEALTTYTPRGPWAQLHRDLSRIGTVQIENVHILANLEPFRYGSADFIQKSVQAMHNVYEANGLHLYPQASYWDWPYSADNTKERLLQIDRDWIWYKQWARYAWNCHRNREDEIVYWGSLLGSKFGGGLQQGKNILEAYEQSGEIAPKLLRRFGITDGNRQTLTLGMLMSQLVNPHRWRLFKLLYDSEGPEGEMLIEYAEKEAKGEKHIGETPVQVIEEVVAHGQKSVEAVERASQPATMNKAELDRIKNDMYCYRALANYFSEKVKAGLLVLRYKYSNSIQDLDAAVPHLEKSVAYFKELADLTKDTYLYANSMQTQQRKIPVGGNDGKNKTWVELLPFYQQELNNFKRNIDSLKAVTHNGKASPGMNAWGNATVTLLTEGEGNYTVEKNQPVFADTIAQILEFAPELKGLKGIKFSRPVQVAKGTSLKFKNNRPVKLVVGYFNVKDRSYLAPSDLETDASANDYGQADVKIANALVLEGLPAVNIHTYSFKPGTNSLLLAKGACLILGFIDDSQALKTYDAGLGKSSGSKEIDWLFD